MFEKSEVVSYFDPAEDKGIFVIEAIKPINPILWIKANKPHFDQMLLKFGGILLRKFDIHAVSEFNRFAQEICPNLLSYTYRSTPRTNLGGKIYTATEYPVDQHIPLHNENAYADSWPQKIMFFCVIPAKEGGETPIADSRKIFKRLDKEIIEKFTKNGVLYVRNYAQGIDLSWQEVFQTSDRLEVEKYCNEHSMQFSWNEIDPELTTKQICQATLTHPVTHEDVWFNQAHLFHVSGLKEDVAQSLLTEFGKESLPRNAYYGDGRSIEEEVLIHIRDAYEKEMIVFKWQKGDLMILDNLLMAHGRRPYSGERKIAVAMG